MSEKEPQERLIPEETPKETIGQAQRRALSEAERIQELRDRLYARGRQPEASVRHTLVTEPVVPKIDGTKMYDDRAASEQFPGTTDTSRPPISYVPQNTHREVESVETMQRKRRAHSFRLKLTLFGVMFFVGALGLSSWFLLYGNKPISGDNITISATGPLTIAGGSEFAYQVSIANQNTVPIDSATLIIEYPIGTQSPEEPGKELSIVRQSLSRINTGEVINVPLSAVLFGEENEEKSIKLSVEYRIAGSNATFEKFAEPLRFKVSSSPVTITVDSLKRISSGQELEISIAIASNATSPLTNLLVRATYPAIFDFNESQPLPMSGEDTWNIPSLKPGEKKMITVRGTMTGQIDETVRFTYQIGVPNERNRTELSSILMTTMNEVEIEPPFLDVNITVHGEPGGEDTTVIDPRVYASVRIDVINTLDTSIYNGKVKATLTGNALDEVEVTVVNGHYDSLTNVITWDSVDVDSLKEIGPGKKGDVSFTLLPRRDIGRAPELKLTVAVEGQRIFEEGVPQSLNGIAEHTIKVQSQPRFFVSALYTEGPYVNSGPIPPVAETPTEYTFFLSVDSGTNDITNALVTAVLPQYVKWLDRVSTGDRVTYDSHTRTIRWDIGNMESNTHEEAWIQVSFTPSLSQVGTAPTLLERQYFTATDRFTGTTIRSNETPLTTRLPYEPDETKRKGEVQRPD